MNKPEHLGDGVYASFDGFHVVLTIEEVARAIFLDRDVLRALMDYGEKVFGVPVAGSLYGNCSVCGEPIDDDDTEVHTDFDGYDCHADCCPVCHEGEPPTDMQDFLAERTRNIMTGFPGPYADWSDQ